MKMTKWYQSQEVDDIIISNRIRLARNIKGYRFPVKMDEYEALALISQMKLVVDQLDGYDFKTMELTKLDALTKKEMMERHIMSPYMLRQSLPSMMILNDEETKSIMVNEEDHLRLQGLGSGQDIKSTWELITKLDDDIEQQIEYAFSEKYGYMTACPTNLGTGLRASYMLHLPLLQKTNYLQEILVAVGKLGMSIRGIYGEGTKPLASIFQISNQKTLGRSEPEIIESVQNIAMHVVGKEQSIRDNISTNAKSKLVDQIYRSYGTLAYARQLDLSEAMNLLSDVKLGFEMGIYHMPKPKMNIYEIIISIQDATIANRAMQEEPHLPTDVIRANVIREYLVKGI